jgi:cytochrome c6
MKNILAALVVAVLSSPAALAQDAGATFQAKCAVCHGKDGKGQNPMGQKLGVKDLSVTKLSAAEIEKTVAEGKGKMTGFKGKMSDAEIKALAAWVKAGIK